MKTSKHDGMPIVSIGLDKLSDLVTFVFVSRLLYFIRSKEAFKKLPHDEDFVTYPVLSSIFHHY